MSCIGNLEAILLDFVFSVQQEILETLCYSGTNFDKRRAM